MTTPNNELLSTRDRRDVISKLKQLSPDFVSLISNFCLGEVYTRPTLSWHTKEVVAIVALISQGSERLKGHFESALAEGLSVEELSEIIMLSSIYLGFPKAIDAMLVLHETANDPE